MIKRHFYKKFLITTSLCLITTIIIGNPLLSQAEDRWDKKNNPAIMEEETLSTHGAFEYKFDKLPLRGHLSKQPWACSYWPTQKRGVAARWHGDVHPLRNKKKKNFSLSDLKGMDKESLANLSPIEKYDIYRCDYNYKLTAEEKERTGNYKTASSWAGLCHGWAPASLNYDEPDCVEMTNKDGLTIPFYSADIKALLTLLQGVYFEAEDTYQVGTKNLGLGFFINPNDLNAGALHVLLTNRIGRFDKGFCSDVDKGRQIWNHPIDGYKSEIVKRHRKSDGREKVRVHTVMTYVGDAVANATERAQIGVGQGPEIRQMEMEYDLDLDRNGKIVGGNYISRSAPHPDFAWNVPAADFTGDFKELKTIYEKSIKH
ncbi:MAG: hypothetical protein HQK50_05810 [Oligoflexia bacterium]|nr:hypothetical protein [Oligoflexia bacterium]MBF0365066.1 hypothetical protein [Oligoflexia bacterium]